MIEKRAIRYKFDICEKLFPNSILYFKNKKGECSVKSKHSQSYYHATENVLIAP